MKQLVVNADDFGLTESVNRGILEAHRQGILTSATLLANGEAFEPAADLAAQSPRLGVGVHLNLTEGPPISDSSKVPSLVDDGGKLFGGPARLLARILSGKLGFQEVEREWSAQIEKVESAGIRVTHLDSHKHVHMLPGLFPIFVRLARRYGIAGVRWAVERPTALKKMFRRNGATAAGMLKKSLQAQALALLAIDSRNRLKRAGLACPMYFYGIIDTGYLDAEELSTILRNLPEGTSELMCHPGYADGALRQSGTRLVAQRERELEALTEPAIRKLVAALDIQLIDYRALADGA